MERFNPILWTYSMVGKILALVMAYQIWGIKGCLFTLGLLMAK